MYHDLLIGRKYQTLSGQQSAEFQQFFFAAAHRNARSGAVGNIVQRFLLLLPLHNDLGCGKGLCTAARIR